MDTEINRDFEALKGTLGTEAERNMAQKEFDKLRKLDGVVKMKIQETDECPDLEEVDTEELERTKQQKNKEWLDKVIAEQEASKAKQEAETEPAVADEQKSQ